MPTDVPELSPDLVDLALRSQPHENPATVKKRKRHHVFLLFGLVIFCLVAGSTIGESIGEMYHGTGGVDGLSLGETIGRSVGAVIGVLLGKLVEQLQYFRSVGVVTCRGWGVAAICVWILLVGFLTVVGNTYWPGAVRISGMIASVAVFYVVSTFFIPDLPDDTDEGSSTASGAR